MDESEHEQLDEIHTEIQGSNAQLGAIAERTRQMQGSLENINQEVQKNHNDINDLQGKVRRNTVIINGVTVGLGSFVLWVSDKLTRFNPFK